MAITALSTPPSRADDASNFSSKSDALLGDLPVFVTEMNAAILVINDAVDDVTTAMAAGLANAANNATTATTQAGIATTQAGIATTQAGIATTKAAEAAASVASIAGGPVASVNGMTGVVTGVVTLTSAQTLTNKTITETVYTLTGTTPALAATNGAVQTWALSAASAPTDSLSSGQSIILVITPGAYSITWPSAVWTKQGGSGALPSLYSAGKTSVVLWKVGSVLYGSHLGDTL